MREKSFIALEGKLRRLRRFCNRCDGARLMIFVELNMSQLRERSGAFLRKLLATALPLLAGRDRGEPAGAGWLMNSIDFVASGRGLEGDFEYEVKKRSGSGALPAGSEENARGDWSGRECAGGVEAGAR
jgi:hypothetical protein